MVLQVGSREGQGGGGQFWEPPEGAGAAPLLHGLPPPPHPRQGGEGGVQGAGGGSGDGERGTGRRV